MKFINSGAVKVSKDDTFSRVIATPTEGGLRLTPEAVKQLNLSKGDYVAVVENDEPGTEGVYIGKVPSDFLGAAKLNDPSGSEGAGVRLAFSSGNGYRLLKGDSNSVSRFDIAKEGGKDDESGLTFYKLTFVDKTPKVVRKAKAAAEASEA